jgi:hypothetical protein
VYVKILQAAKAGDIDEAYLSSRVVFIFTQDEAQEKSRE